MRSIFVLTGLTLFTVFAQPKTYVTGYASDTVLAINQNSLVATIPVGVQPRFMSQNRGGERLYVVNQNSPSVSVIDTRTNQVVGTLATDILPMAVAVTPDERKAFVTLATGEVGVYDLATKALITKITLGGWPYQIAAHPNGSQIFVTDVFSDQLRVIDPRTHKVSRSVTVGYNVWGLKISPDGKEVFVSTQFLGPQPDTGGGAIWAIDAEKLRVKDRIEGYFWEQMAFSADGKTLYALIDGAPVAIRTSNLKLLRSYAIDFYTTGIAPSADGTKLVLPCPLDNATRILNLETGAIDAVIPTGSFPFEVHTITRPDR